MIQACTHNVMVSWESGPVPGTAQWSLPAAAVVMQSRADNAALHLGFIWMRSMPKGAVLQHAHRPMQLHLQCSLQQTVSDALSNQQLCFSMSMQLNHLMVTAILCNHSTLCLPFVWGLIGSHFKRSESQNLRWRSKWSS